MMQVQEELRMLTEKLRADGLSELRYTLRRTKLRTTAVRRGESRGRTDAEDLQLSVTGMYHGKRAMCSFSGIPNAETASVLLRESAQVQETERSCAGALQEAKAGTETGDVKRPAGALEAENLQESAKTLEMKKIQGSAGTSATGLSQEKAAMAAEKAPQTFSWEAHEAVCARLLQAEACGYEVSETALVENCRYEQCLEEFWIYAEDGSLLLSDASGYRCMRTAVMAEKDGSREYTGACRYGKCLTDTEPEALVRETAEEAAGGLFGKSLSSGVYRVILKNSVAAELLEAYLPAFYQSRVKDEQSALCGRTKPAAAAFLSLREEPELAAGRVTRRVDDEGTPVSEKYLMRNGNVETLLSKSPEKAGEPESTGNGFQPDPQSDVETGVTNVILESDSAHQKTQAELFSALSNGLYVTGIDGTFAGTNGKTGHFSLIARGQVIKDGKPAGAFREVTIAANFFDMLCRVTAAGNVCAATAPDMACVLAPALLTEDIVVSGL